MAKATIAGNALVITSEATLAELKTIEKLRPNALTLLGGESGKEPMFRVATGCCGEGTISANGAVFDGATHGDGKATITIPDFGCRISGDPAQAVYDQYGAALVMLNKLEETLGGVMGDIEAEKAGVMAAIGYAQ